ncbi:hypothetical protein SME02_004948 [Klebsiella aerogenes]|nr:hypothetical protein [Klebsiella aerogenes]ELY3087846.1 hypothetical protein [Klebsiella aerogenes]
MLQASLFPAVLPFLSFCSPGGIGSSGVSGGMLLGASAGALLFLVTHPQIILWRRMALTGVSVVAGVLGGEFVAATMTAGAPGAAIASPALGALVTATISVRLLVILGRYSGIRLRQWLAGRKYHD